MTPRPITSLTIYGGTGLVGRHAVELAAARDGVERIVVPVRRAPDDPVEHVRVEYRLVDFDDIHSHALLLETDAVICALGTTIKKAGSQERFREVDYLYPIQIARLGLERGVRHFLLVSAVGADPGSRFFYNRVKGELERDLLTLQYPAITVLRPSFLLGERGESRPAEKIAGHVSFLFPGKYRPVEARQVAHVLVSEAVTPRRAHRVLESDEIRRYPR